MNFKKMNAWLMAVSLTATTVGVNGVPIHADAAQPGMKREVNEETLRENGLEVSTVAKKYDVDENGKVTKYNGTEENVFIPNKKNGRQIQEIVQGVFQNQQNIHSVVISEGITKIGQDAFFNCKALKYVVVPSTVTEIEREAFQNCESLEEIDLSKTSITKIAEGTFKSCKNLKKVILPEGLLFIEADVFMGCGQLADINMENLQSLGRIGSGAFGNCISLTNVVLPESVTRISNGAFANCIQLQTITIPARVTEFGQAVLTGNSNVTIKGTINSLAYNYAKKKDISFQPVSEEILVSSIELSGTDITLDKENIKKLNISEGTEISVNVKVSSDATNQNFCWECEKEGIVEISKDGVIKAMKKGFTAVVVRAAGGVNKTDYMEINVI